MEAKHELIAEYLAGTLSKEECKAFDQQFFSDETFAEEVSFYLQAKAAAKAASDEQRLQAFTQHYFQQKPTPMRTLRRMQPVQWAIAAAVVLLISTLALLNLRSPELPELYAAHFSALEVDSSVRDQTQVDQQWTQAMEFYEAKKYTETITLLESISDQEKIGELPKVSLYLGMCHMLQGKDQQALEAFERVAPESIYIQDAYWYTALLYLKMDNKENAKTALQRIVDFPAHYKQSIAKELLIEMK